MTAKATKATEQKGKQQALMVSNSKYACNLKTIIDEIREEQKMFREHFKSHKKVNESIQIVLKMILTKISKPSSSAPATSGT